MFTNRISGFLANRSRREGQPSNVSASWAVNPVGVLPGSWQAQLYLYAYQKAQAGVGTLDSTPDLRFSDN
jgi:hypothetical protein